MSYLESALASLDRGLKTHGALSQVETRPGCRPPGRRLQCLKTHGALSQVETVTADNMKTVRAGVIQNFEVAYEQCWKMMKRWLEANVSSQEEDGVTRRELFRVAAENRLIDEVDAWMGYHDARNLTSHTYSAENAAIVIGAAGAFLPAAASLQERITARND